MSNYEKNFTSCEDSLPDLSCWGVDGGGGLSIFFNGACSLTSILIMAVPLYHVHKAFFTPVVGAQKRIREVQLYSLVNTLLFFGNLYQHATGYIGPPCLDTLGCVNNLILASVIYRAWHCAGSTSTSTKCSAAKNNDVATRIMNRISPRLFTTIMSALTAIILLAGPMVGQELETWLTLRLTPPLSLCVIVMMGRVTFHQQKQQQLRLQGRTNDKKHTTATRGWNLYRWSVALLIATVVLGELEPMLICHSPMISDAFQRSYHSIFLHSIISSLFGTISQLTFEITSELQYKPSHP